MHVVKDYDERKTEFLDTAMQLFMQNGYEQTSVAAIIDAVGVSKGAFYHYFKTKEELLDELATRASEQALAIVEPLVDEPGLSAVEKLNEVFRRTNSFKAQNRDLVIAIARVFYGDANLLLRTKLSGRSIGMVAPLLARIFELGNREGSMSVSHPQETARFVLRIGAELASVFARQLPTIGSDPQSLAMVVREIDVYTISVERIVGMAPGSLALVDESMMKLLKGE